MDYAKAVTKGRTLLTRSEQDQWELALLTAEVVAAGERGIQRRWAEDLGVSYTHVWNLNQVWLKYGRLHDAGKATKAFNEYYTLAGGSKARAAQLENAAKKGGRSVGTVHRRSLDRDGVESARALLRNRRSMREILRDPKVHAMLERHFRGPARNGDPLAAKRPGRRLQLQFVEDVTRLRHGLNSTLGDMIEVKLSQDIRRPLDEELEDLGISVEWARGYVRSGDLSFEDALDSVLADAAFDADADVAEPDEAPPPPPVKKPRKRASLKPVAEEAEAEVTAGEPADGSETGGTKRPRRKPARERPEPIERPRRGRRSA